MRRVRGGEIRPADDAGDDGTTGREGEEVSRLRLGRGRLDQDRRLDAVTGQDRREVGHREVPVDRREVRRQPAVIAARDLPEMVVGVDPHRQRGTGAVGSSSPSALRSAHKAGGRRVREAGEVAGDLLRRRGAQHDRGDGRMGERELQRRVGEGDAMRAADPLDPRHAVQDGGRRRLVIVGRAGDGAGREDARIEHPAQHHADAFPFGKRQEFVQGRLLQERVAAGEQHGVEIAGLGEADAHLGFVESDPDRPDGSRCAQSVERPISAVHRFAEPVLGRRPMIFAVHVVDEQDVDAVEPEPQQRLLDRAHRAVIGVVEPQRVREAAHITGPALPGRARLGHAPDLGREDERLPRHAAQGGAAAVLREAVAVERRRIDEGDAVIERGRDRRDGGRVVEARVKIADRGRPEPDARHHQRGSPEAARSEGGRRRAHPPLTAPAVRPATIWRCAKTVRTRTGKVTISAAAASGPQLNWSNEIML